MLAFKLVVRPPGPRVVLDTNLFVAAYWSARSASARILDACEESRVVLLTSAAIRAEMARILRNARTSEAFQRRVWLLVEDGEEVRPTRRLRLVPDDPDDDKFLECALEGGARSLVSSDDHLLRLGRVEGVEILKPGDFVRRYL